MIILMFGRLKAAALIRHMLMIILAQYSARYLYDGVASNLMSR
ncbi:MAG: hypothetical protein K0Q90_4296 [Paenibacillaceae bacterium]|nr:hypothetical protein [Paenibacillaceae bacterium]